MDERANSVRTLAFSVVPVPGLLDDSVISPRIHERSYSRVMLVPPSGTAGPAFNVGYAAAERAIMRRGIELISPAITGRVIGAGESGGGAGDAGLELSDLERALLLAERSNADAVLQIGELSVTQPERLGVDREASTSAFGARYFRLASGGLEEVSANEYDRTDRLSRWRLCAPAVRFSAKLIDVESGFILASFHYEADLSRRLPRRYDAELVLPAGSVESVDWKWSDPSWTEDAVREAFTAMFSSIGSYLSPRDTGDSASG